MKVTALAQPTPLVDEFPGLTARDCCDTCGPNCVITQDGSGICAHPHKSALQSLDAANPAIVAKHKRAKLEIRRQEIEQDVRR
jgi:hypothetical protein